MFVSNRLSTFNNEGGTRGVHKGKPPLCRTGANSSDVAAFYLTQKKTGDDSGSELETDLCVNGGKGFFG